MSSVWAALRATRSDLLAIRDRNRGRIIYELKDIAGIGPPTSADARNKPLRGWEIFLRDTAGSSVRVLGRLLYCIS